MNGKRAFLVTYKREIGVRYEDGTVGKGTASKSAYVLAGSAEDVEARYPDLEVIAERPFWLDQPMEITPGVMQTMDEMLRADYTVDIDEVESKWLSQVRDEV